MKLSRGAPGVLALLLVSSCARTKGVERASEPTSAAEAQVAHREAAAHVQEKYRQWKATLSPERQAWETLLEKHLGTFYLPRHQAAIVSGMTDAWEYVEDDPLLPRVLIIGDSISVGYTSYVRQALAGKANVHRAPANCGYTYNVSHDIEDWLGTGKWDVIHFNFGIHDRNTPIAAYEHNLVSTIERLRKTGAKLIWGTTTPIPFNSPYGWMTKFSMMRRNAAAKAVMIRYRVEIDDLFVAVDEHLDVLQRPNDVHFTQAGSKLLGQTVADSITAALAKERQRMRAGSVSKN